MAEPKEDETSQEISIRKKIIELIQASGTCLDLASLESGLNQIPEEIFAQFCDENLEKITELNLDFNDFISLPESISHLKGLLKLSAEGNDISTLPLSVGELLSLQELRMSENQVRELPMSFSSLGNLCVLSLVANELQCLSAEIVEGLARLVELYLDENQLSILPENFGVLKSLQILELSENKLTSLPESFGELRQLQILNVSRNSLSDLPNTFGELCQLRKVDLSDNNLSTLPEEFCSVSVIENLYLDNNILGILPEWFGQLSKIVHLSMSDNKLQGCPLQESFPRISKSTLKKLEIGGNSISKLPESLGELQCLEELHLGSTICELERRNFQNGNWIRELPESFGHLRSIRKLHLDENQLGALPVSFGSLVSLSWLDLGQNLLLYLPESFCELQSLEYCQLSKNKLVCLPLNFGKLKKLVDLRLDQNLLEELPKSCSNLQLLHTLDLFDNKLKAVPSWLSQLSSLKRLDLDGNKLSLKLKDIPHLASKGSEYADRDPNLKDNWRGKTRADKIKAEVVVISQVDTNEDEEEDENISLTDYSENTLFAAMRRGLSIWKTHSGLEERKCQGTGDMNSEEFTFNLFEDIADDSTAKNSGFYVKLHPNTNHDAEGMSDAEEDWDREINESWRKSYVGECLIHTIGVEVSQVEIEKKNEFLTLLSAYPPASQAFTPTATYQSLAFDTACKNAKNNNLYDTCQQAVFIQGQFDDAD